MKEVHFEHLDHINTQMDMDAVRALARTAKDRAQRHMPVAVEVGAWAGFTTKVLADHGFIVFAVDHWYGSPKTQMRKITDDHGRPYVYRTFCRNMGSHLMRRVVPLIGSSEMIACGWPDDLEIDLLYIDADHTYESVLLDINLWSPKVRKGGIISGHDYGSFPGVTKAVGETGQFELAGNTVWWREKS